MLSTTHVNNILELPDDCLVSIFEFLSPRQILSVGEVCRRFFVLSRHSWVWRSCFRSQVGPALSDRAIRRLPRMLALDESTLDSLYLWYIVAKHAGKRCSVRIKCNGARMVGRTQFCFVCCTFMCGGCFLEHSQCHRNEQQKTTESIFECGGCSNKKCVGVMAEVRPNCPPVCKDCDASCMICGFSEESLKPCGYCKQKMCGNCVGTKCKRCTRRYCQYCAVESHAAPRSAAMECSKCHQQDGCVFCTKNWSTCKKCSKTLCTDCNFNSAVTKCGYCKEDCCNDCGSWVNECSRYSSVFSCGCKEQIWFSFCKSRLCQVCVRKPSTFGCHKMGCKGASAVSLPNSKSLQLQQMKHYKSEVKMICS